VISGFSKLSDSLYHHSFVQSRVNTTIPTTHILPISNGAVFPYLLLDEHVDNFWMDIPLFSTARTIQRLKQRIQTFVEGEAAVDYHKIDVILNATDNKSCSASFIGAAGWIATTALES